MTRAEYQARHAQWVAWARQGWTPRQIAAVAGVTPDRVREVLRRDGWHGSKRPVTAAEVAQWIRWRQQGWSIDRIAARTGRGWGVVQRHLQQAGEPPRRAVVSRVACPPLTPAEQADVERLRWLFAHIRPGASVDAVLGALQAAGDWRGLIDDLRARARLVQAR
ncbi:MAG: hypothetical protein K6V97_04100 [Actinomycetia bacterium]|nr:hypothetical protein [Actinomycetes bacterium]